MGGPTLSRQNSGENSIKAIADRDRGTRLSRLSRLPGRAASVALALLLSACASQPNFPFLSHTGLDPERVEEIKAAQAKEAELAAAGPPIALDPASGASRDPTRPPVGEFELAGSFEGGELRFQPGDTAKVSVWGYPELDHIGAIQPNGNITLPLVGEVPAAEATVAELRSRITDRLAPYTRVSTPDLRPGDTLVFQVWREDSLRHLAVIDPRGFATFPVVGEIRAAGRPVEEIRGEAQSRLAQFLRDPNVSVLPVYNNRRVLQDHSVSVLAAQLQPRRVAVLGEVAAPGLADINGSIRLVDALAKAAVRRPTADLNGVLVIRNPSVGAPAYRVIRVQDFLDGRAPDQNIYLRNGDIVIVPQSTIAKVGEFVELFLSRTLPAFQWWFAAYEASTTPQRRQYFNLINESLRRGLNSVTVSPNP